MKPNARLREKERTVGDETESTRRIFSKTRISFLIADQVVGLSN
ncbi:hypothetical protein APA_2570 [Pseudanabaena sp. lw0831]|nr:hypothetical protein APA_2570 [Pseudanabaena sp. lw0831]